MRLLYYEAPNGNFGDDLNAWIWDELLPGWRDWDDDVTLIGVGTLLNRERLGGSLTERLLIAGTGAGYGSEFDLPLPDNWDIRAVRGPLSAAALNLPPERGIIDPAAMIPLMEEFSASSSPNSRPIFVPHVASVTRHDWERVCRRAEIDFLSPCDPSKEVIHRIASAPLVLAESMHAAILADAFRIPWIPLHVGDKANFQKWYDWAGSLDLEIAVAPLFWEFGLIRKFLGKSKPKFYLLAKQKKAIGDPNSPARPAGQTRKKRTSRIKDSWEEAWVVSRLRQAVRRPSYLSDTSCLRRQQDMFKRILLEIRERYGSP